MKACLPNCDIVNKTESFSLFFCVQYQMTLNSIRYPHELAFLISNFVYNNTPVWPVVVSS